MREYDWLRSGHGPDEQDYFRQADSFVPGEPREQHQPIVLRPIERFQKGELTSDLWGDVAQSLRDELLDHYVSRVVYASGEQRADEEWDEVQSLSESVIREDQLGLVEDVLEWVKRPHENLSPIRALYLRWEAAGRGVMVLSIGSNDSWFLSVAVAPYEEFWEEATPSQRSLPILERRWEGVSGDGSLTRSLELALSGDLERLMQLGFEDRVEQTFDYVG